jgi:tetratricopeptide (TPR) repeat protein
MCLCFAYEKYVKNNEERRKIATTVAVALIAVCSVRTVIRNEDWKTPQRFWRATAEASPLSPRAHNNMGDAYAQEENYAGAIKEFKASVQLKPDYADAYHNLGNIYQHVGNLQDAIVNYEKAISLNPNLFESYYNLAVAYVNSDQPDKAITLVQEALKNWPDNSELAMVMTYALNKKNAKP